MKEAMIVIGFGLCFLYGVFIGADATDKKAGSIINEKLATKQLQLKIATERNKECRYTLKLILDELDYIQPRAITVD
jgi:hypothetical protein